MSVIIGTLTIDLQANTASFSQGMEKMAVLSAKTAKDITRSLEKITAAGLAMAAAIATGTIALIKSSLDTADALVKAAQAAGTTTETLSELSYAGKLSNVSMESITKGLEKLSQAAFKAQNGNVQLDRIFGRLGVSFLDSNGKLKDSGVIMQDVSQKFATLGDGAAKTALAMALFGKGGAALLPLLNQYGEEQDKVNEEAHRFGLVLSTSTGEVAARAHDNLDRLSAVFEGMGFSLMAATLPALDELLNRLIQIANNSDLQGLAKSFGGNVTSAIHLVGNALSFATEHAHELKIALEALIALQLSRIALPLVTDLIAGGGLAKAGAGISGFVLKMTGMKNVAATIPKLGESIAAMGSSFGRATQELTFMETATLGVRTGFGGVGTSLAAIKALSPASMFASLGGALQAIPGFLSMVVSGAWNASKALMLAALSNPWTIAAMAIIALGAVLYKFRNSVFSLKGETYQIRDTWNAAWIVMKNVVRAFGDEFMKLVDKCKSLWNSLMTLIGGQAIEAALSKMWSKAMEWINRALGKLTPQWAVDALNQAKNERLAAASSGDDRTVAPKPKAKESPDTSGLGKESEDPDAQARANMAERLRDSKLTLEASGLGEEAQRKAMATNKANDEILKLGQEIAKVTHSQTKDFAKLVSESTKQLLLHGEALLSDQAHMAKMNDLIGAGTRATALSVSQAGRMINAIYQGTDAIAKQNAQAQAENELTEQGATTDQIAARAKDLYAKAMADETVAVVANLEAMGRELTSKQLVTSATLEDINVQREAALQAKLVGINYQIATMALGPQRDELIKTRDATVAMTEAEWDERDAQEAVSLLSPHEQYKRESVALDNAVAALSRLKNGKISYGEQLQIAARQQELFNKMIDQTVDSLLRQDSLSAGVDAFFLNMRKQAQTAASIIFDALNSTFTKLSTNLTELMTGGKADFGAMFKDIGKQMLDSTLKSGMQKGIAALGKTGALGKTLGGLLGDTAKADGSKSSPFWVKLVDGAGLGGFAGLESDGLGSDSGSSDSGGKSAGGGGFMGILSKVFGSFLTPHKEGGSVSPGSAYLVGEQGPELLTGASGNITSNAASQRMMSGSGGAPAYYTIDARGTDPVLTEQRTRQALIAVHGSAVSSALHAGAEHSKRVPGGR
ncbi:MAG TPA: phage tail tape measure C-terminal domain-containing protein [Pyrinomonadaceae bacterium]|jgi:hypothetical protein|nr:phage tail tape measure C-terminal domain-containing protein [Pyrinomonadaceae bacterium]